MLPTTYFPEVEMVAIQNVNEALERVIKRDVKYRFVIEFEKSLRSSRCKWKKLD